MSLKVSKKEPEVDKVEIGRTYGSAVYVNWRNLGEMLRKVHHMEDNEGIGGVRVDEHGIHVFFSDDPREQL